MWLCVGNRLIADQSGNGDSACERSPRLRISSPTSDCGRSSPPWRFYSGMAVLAANSDIGTHTTKSTDPCPRSRDPACRCRRHLRAVVAAVAGECVVERVAGAVEDRAARQRHVLAIRSCESTRTALPTVHEGADTVPGAEHKSDFAGHESDVRHHIACGRVTFAPRAQDGNAAIAARTRCRITVRCKCYARPRTIPFRPLSAKTVTGPSELAKESRAMTTSLDQGTRLNFLADDIEQRI